MHMTRLTPCQPQVPAATQQMQTEPASWLQADALRQPQQAQQQYSNWQQPSAPQQAPRVEPAQQQYSGHQDQWQPSYPGGSQQPSSFQQDSFRWQDSQSGTMAFQQPDATQFSPQADPQSQIAGVPQQSGAQQQTAGPVQQQPQQEPQQQQRQSVESQNYDQIYGQRINPGYDQRYDQRQQTSMQQPSSYAGSARKVEQQRRSSVRQTAGVEEPRFDPRRRKASQGSTAMPGQPVAVQQRQSSPSQQSQAAADSIARRSQSPQPYFSSSSLPQQSPRQAGSAAANPLDSSQNPRSPGAADQGYSGWLEQQNGGQLSEPFQVRKHCQVLFCMSGHVFLTFCMSEALSGLHLPKFCNSSK